MQTVSGLGELWDGAELTVVDSKALPKRPRVIVRISDTSEVTTVMTRLRIQNPELYTTDWSVMSRKVTEKEQMLEGLNISPHKTAVVPFTNRRNKEGLGPLILYGKELTMLDGVKYLGVI